MYSFLLGLLGSLKVWRNICIFCQKMQIHSFDPSGLAKATASLLLLPLSPSQTADAGSVAALAHSAAPLCSSLLASSSPSPPSRASSPPRPSPPPAAQASSSAPARCDSAPGLSTFSTSHKLALCYSGALYQNQPQAAYSYLTGAQFARNWW